LNHNPDRIFPVDIPIGVITFTPRAPATLHVLTGFHWRFWTRPAIFQMQMSYAHGSTPQD